MFVVIGYAATLTVAGYLFYRLMRYLNNLPQWLRKWLLGR